MAVLHRFFIFTAGLTLVRTAGLTLVLLYYDISVFENSVDSDQLASDEAS